jgi:hypothetical protein
VNHQFQRSIRHIAAGAAAGLLLAAAIGWGLAPAGTSASTPAELHPDYQDEYVMMIAASYEVEQDIDLVKERLLLLEPDRVCGPLLELAERLAQTPNNDDEVARLANLAWILGETTPALVPYLEGAP